MAVDLPPKGRRPSAIASLVLRRRDAIEIVLDVQPGAYVQTFTTLDSIDGKVVLKFDKDTAFDIFGIFFEGATSTFVEKVATPTPQTGRSVGSQVFMRVVHPFDQSTLPRDGIAKAGETYQVPFSFVVPERLLDHICQHSTTTRNGDTDPTKEEHIQVPPSVGDCMVAGDGQKLLDDMAPEMAKIIYSIRVLVAKRKPTASHKDQEIASRILKVRIVPAREEKPPLSVTANSVDYRLRKEKAVKRGSFKVGKLGWLVAEANQPRALVLPTPNQKLELPVASSTTINLRFDPLSDASSPPALGLVTTRLKVYTYFATSAFRSIPDKNILNHWDTNRSAYVASVDLSAREVSNVKWTKHTPSESSLDDVCEDRRESSASTDSTALSATRIPSPSGNHQSSLPYYTASIFVPISLPYSTSPGKTKTFLPTFHTCLVSRVYVLDVAISYHNPFKTMTTPTISLKLPIQVASRGNPNARPMISAEEQAAINARNQMFEDIGEAAEYWRPRRLTFVPDGTEITPDAMHTVPEYSEVIGETPPRRPSSTAQSAGGMPLDIHGQYRQQRQTSSGSLAESSTSESTSSDIHLRGGDLPLASPPLHRTEVLPDYASIVPISRHSSISFAPSPTQSHQPTNNTSTTPVSRRPQLRNPFHSSSTAITPNPQPPPSDRTTSSSSSSSSPRSIDYISPSLDLDTRSFSAGSFTGITGREQAVGQIVRSYPGGFAVELQSLGIWGNGNGGVGGGGGGGGF
ncbi:putative arrestin (or s-antigen) n-terminal domain protein [Phaeomoniella chlamydospora]|uniref:Putative arrestin (Or s-antigen) n-terminal domain protein n=1 Tax=Phaeomoniella chlamydospora TaxID=158046 RepID=A0A0G2DX20_PHACM|nr:putative arrestin (or s-antigen) n-terminal domain protein [Phaeomoniella chlamydospora]